MADNNQDRVFMGYVGFAYVDGGYQTGYNYRRMQYITTEDSTYLSIADNNKGNPLTDKTKWRCLASGAAATAAAKQALEAYNNCLAKITEVNALIQDLQDASGVTAETEAALTSINSKMAEVAKLTEQLNTLRDELYSAVKAANSAYAIASAITGVDVYSHIPASLVVSYDAEVPLGSSQTIGKELFPSTANQSVVFISKDVDVTPDGVVSSPAEAGDVTIYVVSTEQSKLWKKVTIHFRELVARTTESGAARTTEDGTAIEC